jgi:mono/diheme cytochrome c family protein
MLNVWKRDRSRMFVPRIAAIGAISGGIAALFLFAGCQRAEQQAETQTSQAPPASASIDPVARGKYLVTVGSCNDCHTPWKMGEKGPEPDMTKYLSGHPQEMVVPPPPQLSEGPWMWLGTGTMTAFAGPWGVSYTANLTPDDETGIGVWTEDIFINAMRSGKHWRQTRPILPPMPWFSLAAMTDEDLKAVFSFLKSLPPIKNMVPEPVIAPAPGT